MAATVEPDGELEPRVLGTLEFEQCFRAYSPQVFRYAARRIGPTAAEDLCAQTFAEAWSNRARFDANRGSTQVWLMGIATNLIRRHHRSETRQLRAFARVGSDHDADDAISGAIDRVHATGVWPTMASELLRLRAVDRDLFWLQVTTDMSYAELAAATGVAVGTVRSRLARTRERLRASLDEPELPPATPRRDDGFTQP